MFARRQCLLYRASWLHRAAAVLLGLSLLAGPGGPAPALSRAEPADCDPTSAEGCAVTFGDTVSGDLSATPGPQSWWLDVDQAGTVLIYLFDLPSPLRFTFNDAKGRELWHTEENNTQARGMRTKVEAGRYRLGVEAISGEPAASPYRLLVTVPGSPARCETPRVGTGGKLDRLSGVATEFPVGTRTFSAGVFCTNVTPGQTWGDVWQREGTPIDTPKLVQGTFPTEYGYVGSTINLHRAEGAAPGHYTVIFVLDQQEVTRTDFVVK